MTGPRSLHVISSLRLSAGGPTQSVVSLCEALAQLGAPAEIATLEDPKEPCATPMGIPVHAFPVAFPAQVRRSPALRAFLYTEAPRFDLVHVHGLWEWPGVAARRAAVKGRLPLVVSPRGMLEPWSLQQRKWLKWLALGTWEGRTLEACSLLHATASSEAEQFRRLGLRAPSVVVPNGLVFPPPVPELRKSEPPTALFLSRLHPKKGADLLLRAWAQQVAGPWRLVIAGPDPDGLRPALENLAQELALGERVTFLGPQYGEAKWALFRRAHLFILPSHSENFGNVVPEALSQGLPVIATEGTPWEGLHNHGCGWWIPPTVEGLCSALGAAMALDLDTLATMGQRGQSWAQESFSATASAQKMYQAYEALLNGAYGELPKGDTGGMH